MRTFVTTYPDHNYLLKPFFQLATKFYCDSIIVHEANQGEPKSDQLQRLLKSIDDEYFILLESDFWFVLPVDMILLSSICNFCQEHKVDRFSLQSKRAHSFQDWVDTKITLKEHPVYQSVPEVFISFSLEASVWKKSFLLSQLQSNWSDAQIEVNVSNNIRGLTSYKIYALETEIMHYRDALRGGEQVIKLLEDPLRLQVEEGNALALFPLEENNKNLELLL